MLTSFVFAEIDRQHEEIRSLKEENERLKEEVSKKVLNERELQVAHQGASRKADLHYVQDSI